MSAEKQIPDWKRAIQHALAYLRKRGAWTKYEWGFAKDWRVIKDENELFDWPETPPRCLCLSAALIYGAGLAFPKNQIRSQHASDKAECVVVQKIYGSGAQHSSGPASWNDAHSRKKKDVLQLLEELAA